MSAAPVAATTRATGRRLLEVEVAVAALPRPLAASRYFLTHVGVTSGWTLAPKTQRQWEAILTGP
jgi:hypothetical protein